MKGLRVCIEHRAGFLNQPVVESCVAQSGSGVGLQPPHHDEAPLLRRQLTRDPISGLCRLPSQPGLS